METIVKVWFEKEHIFIETNKGNTFSRPLKAFPILYDATSEQREFYKIGKFGDDIRWEMLDEDVHIDSFYSKQEMNPDNPIAKVFSEFPQINISQFAKKIGINKSLMARYIYGIKTPSPERKTQIEKELHKFGKELLEVSF
jgi:hypothetical protein